MDGGRHIRTPTAVFPRLRLLGNESLPGAVKRVACMLCALKNVREALQTYYKQLELKDEVQHVDKRRRGRDESSLLDQPPPFIGPTFNTFVKNHETYALERVHRRARRAVDGRDGLRPRAGRWTKVLSRW